MNSRPLSRRHFMAALLGLSGSAGLLETVLTEAQAAPGYKTYKIGPWQGDDFTFGHKMRNGELPYSPDSVEKLPTEKRDFVIVGGGLSALAAAYRLKGQDFVLLEQYKDLGGQARGGSHNGLDYSLGSAYFTSKEGAVGELLSALNLKPAAFAAEEKHAFYANKSWHKAKDRDFMERGHRELKPLIEPLLKGNKGEGADSQLSAILTALPAQYKSFLDSYLLSSICGGINDLSAIAGAQFLEDLFLPSYVLPGGNSGLTKALVADIRDKSAHVRCGAFVWLVKIKDKGALVVYQDKSGVKAINCKHVILTAPPMVTGRILTGVSNKAKGDLFAFRYGSYMVANLQFSEQVFKGPYDNFSTLKDSSANQSNLTDIVIAESPYLVEKTYKQSMGSVLTVYSPWRPGSAGRELLLEGNQQKLLKPLMDSLAKLGVLNNTDKLQQISLSRWGHAMVVPTVRYFDRLAAIKKANDSPNYSLAHSSLMGIQCLESALEIGFKSAERALK